jgi:hypothetical protein
MPALLKSVAGSLPEEKTGITDRTFNIFFTLKTNLLPMTAIS